MFKAHDVAWRLCCDADLMPIVLGSASEILDVGQTKRLVTPAIRKALSFRDGGCVFPSSAATDAACEAHHIRPWWAEGVTSLSNMVLFCPHHQKLVEPDRFDRDADRWSIHLDPDSGWAVLTPPGRTRRFTAMEQSEDKRFGGIVNERGSPRAKNDDDAGSFSAGPPALIPSG